MAFLISYRQDATKLCPLRCHVFQPCNMFPSCLADYELYIMSQEVRARENIKPQLLINPEVWLGEIDNLLNCNNKLELSEGFLSSRTKTVDPLLRLSLQTGMFRPFLDCCLFSIIATCVGIIKLHEEQKIEADGIKI